MLILFSISKKACTHGAISFRNKTNDSKIPLIEEASKLKDSSYITYYKNSKNNIEKDKEKLWIEMNVGDVLIYTPDIQYYKDKKYPGADKPGYDPGYTGHTATILKKGIDNEGRKYFDILEFHIQDFDNSTYEQWNEATLKRVYADSNFNTFVDCNFYGGASWN